MFMEQNMKKYLICLLFACFYLSGAAEHCACQSALGKKLAISIPDNYYNPDWVGLDYPKMADLYTTIRYNRGNPLWSPDGKWIVFTDSNFKNAPGFGPYGIWMVSKNGGLPILLYDNYNTEYLDDRRYSIPGMRPLCFTPDGSEVTFRKMTVDETKGSEVYEEYGRITVDNPYPVIYSVNITTKEVRTIVEGAYSGCWSPDGSSFIFIRDDEIGIADGKTGKERIVLEITNEQVVQPDTPVNEFLVSRYRGLYSVSLPLDTCTLELFMVMEISNNTHYLSFVTVFSPDHEWILYKQSQIQSQEELRAFNAYSGESETLVQNSMGQYLFKDEIGWWGKAWAQDGSAFCFEMFQLNSLINDYTTDLYLYDFALESRRPSSADPEEPASFGLLANYPNPFNLSTTIVFSENATERVDLSVYNIAGQRIRGLFSDTALTPGIHRVFWDGHDDYGRPVSSGVYILYLRGKTSAASGRMMLVK